MKFNLTSMQKSFYTKGTGFGDTIWNHSVFAILDKKYSRDKLNEAYNSLVSVNDCLRARIEETVDGPMVIIDDFRRKEYPYYEFSSDEEMDKWAVDVVNAPLDFRNSPINCALFNTPEHSGIFIWAHHILVDGFSSFVMADYINNYLAQENFVFSGNQSYSDYVDAEKKYTQSRRFEQAKAFWGKNFSEEIKLNLIPNKSQPVDFSSDEVNVEIPTDLFLRIRNFCANYEISPASFFNTVYAIYISRIYDVDNFAIGVPVLNRTTIAEMNTIGLYMHLLPLVVHLKDDSFVSNARDIEDFQINLFRYQKFTQSDIIDLLSSNGRKVRSLFDIVSDFQEFPRNDDFNLRFHYCNSLSVPLEIHLQGFTDDCHRIKIRYRLSMFTEKEMQRMLGAVLIIAEEAVSNPEKKICEFETLTAEERSRLLTEFNDTKAEYPKDKCVYELFEEQVRRTPEETAVVAADKTLTYEELNEEANRIAHSLIEKGVGKGDIVGLMLPRKSYLLSALFGILKTGAAYLPIDPDHPEDRIKYMLSDSNARLCITEENIAELLSNTNTENTDTDIDSSDLCYCIYTSGSTGKPKGTLLTHRNVVNYVSANEKNVYYGITGKENRNILSVTTVGFDIFVTESILPLVNGMSVILADENEAKIQHRLIELLKKHPADILQTTPTKMRIFMSDKTALGYLKSFKVIILGGEELDGSLVKDISDNTSAEIYNIYGPTEATVWASYSRIHTPEDITIGRPVANTQMHVVDKNMKLVPIGVTGELCIAGDSVSAGYLNRSELTAEKFIGNPFGEGKLYRTGDNAYRREDGSIVFVGRSDFQVKIRGLRIELGEIESAISETEGINQSVVVVRKDSEDRQLLCAFYTGEEKSVKELRIQLGEKLPKYMVPHVFTRLEEMPLTTSGKIDRKALPEIDLNAISAESEYVAPSTENEKLLTECIKDVLGTENVSVLDNFFDIGGDSLKSIELTARLEEKGYTVAVKTIFSSKDIRELANALEEKETEEVYVEYGNVIPVTAAQLRVYTAQMLKPDSTMYNVTFAFRTDKVDKGQLEKTINGLIERHEILRTRFENRNGQIVQIIEEKAEITVEDVAEEEINGFDRPFELHKAPLVRVGCNEKSVVISLHHICVDGESMPVFIREFNELYMGREIKQSAVQYGEFAVTEGYSKENEQYWLNVFRDEIPTLELPSDYARGSVQSFNGSSIYEKIDLNLHQRIEELCKKTGVTPYVYYMACLNILLSVLSGNDDIVVGTPISGRKSRYLNTIGMFVNTIALRSTLDGRKTVGELLKEISRNSVSAIENQNYPFGELVKKLNVSAQGRNPLFDVMLAFQSVQMTDTGFTDKKIEPVFLTSKASKCDMTFTVYPRQEEVLLSVEYCTDLYKEERVRKFTEQYVQLLEGCLDDSIRISEISLAEKTLTEGFNSTFHRYDIPESSTLYSLFEKTAKENCEKICIKTAERELSFGELISVAERTDAAIRDITNDTKSVIAVIAERSPEMYGAIYGIIRGGNAYLPIDPEYPQDRISYILENSNAAAVAVQGKFACLCGNLPVIDMTEILNAQDTRSENAPACCAEPDDTAYVIYTSGSTGNPKGAKISHKSIVNRILWMHDKYPLEDTDVILQKTPYTFDVSVWEHFWWGMTGGSLAVSAPGEHFIPEKILIETERNKVTHLHFVPSVFEIFLNYLETHREEIDKFNSVKYVFLSGEALSASLVQRFYRLYDFRKVTLHNLYGPTECAVDVTYYDCRPEDTDPIPIGKPIYNTQMYVVDKYMNLVPVGVQGEICIAGMNVGQGYLNNPELTNEKFIDNPFGEGKLYRTGDLGYRCEDGNIVFIGRNDFQVKIHGQRIELGEIENAVSSVDGITLCVAAVREDAEGRQYICVFYTGEEKTAKEIKDTISGTLPKYMVPNIFTYLSEMPLTSSGKINRKALPEVDPVSIVTNEEYIAPETNEEKALAEVVCKVLKMENINMLDNFFYLGGDSIIAIHIVSLLEEMGYALRVANIMMSETLSDIAKKMTPVSDSAIYDQNETNGLVSFSPVMRAYLNEHGATENNFVQHCVITADCDENEAKAALDALVAHHDILRGTIEENGLLIHPCAEREVYSFNSISIADTEKAKQYLNNINVSDNTLINAVFCTTENGNLMSITVHHFLVDLVSWEILIADFNTAIKQIRSNEDISLPAKTATFGMWNEKLKGYKENISPESKEYWEDINRNLEKTKTFVSDSVNKAEEYNFAFDKTVSEKLMGEANKAYSTKIHEILLTATGLAAGTIAGGDIGVLVEGHGRADPDNQISVDRTVGWFTSCYPVIVRNNGNVAEEIITTKETLRRISSKGIDYLLLNEKVHRNTSIVFNYYKNNVNDNGFVAFGGAGALFPDKINFNCFVDDGILKVNISVSESRHVENICEKLGLEFRKQLEKIVEFCTGATTVVRTRSDFSDTELTEQEFIELTEQFDMQYIENISALTPSQEGIFAQYIQNPETKTYKLSNLIRVGKDTDIEMLRKSVRLLAVRHSVLRTAFAVMKSTGAIKQVVLSDRLPEFKVISVNEPFSQNVSDTISAEITSGAFDLHKDSLFRITVIDFNDARFIHMHTHHIILDGWCFPVIINDIQKVYAELSVGKTEQEIYEGISNESASETSYSDYVAWIRNQDKTQASVYWKNLLDDFEASHIFGKEKKDNSKNEDIFTFRTPLEEELSQRIRKFARENNVSFNTVFECAFGVALQKFSGSDDVVYDKIISGRSIPLSNVSETLGLFINTVPVRIRSEEKTSVADLLKATQKQTAEADKNGILPLADVYKNSSVESRSVDALFVFENYFTGEESEITNGILTPELISFDEQTEFNLTVTIIREGSGYAVRTSYAREIYSEREISDFVKGYIYVLEAALDNKKLIKNISVADTEQLAEFNSTFHRYDIPESSTLYSLFEKTAEENLTKICIKTAERELSFGELISVAERTDAAIRDITNDTKSVIAVIAERSPEMYGAIYGIIRGGNAYLPIDPEYPQDRISYILENSNAAAVAVQGKFACLCGNLPVIDMTEILNAQDTRSENAPACCAEPDDTAYVIYTSGSTGNPKGAKISHKSIVNRILWMHDKYPLEDTDVILQKTPYTFDVSVWEHFWWGMTGGSLAVSAPGEHFIPEKILIETERNKVTHLHFVPSVFEIFLNYLETHREEIDKFNSVKYVFLSGEALSASLVQRFYRLYDFRKVTLHNLYGPTECAVDVTYYDCRPEDTDPIPIGKPIYNTQMYVVDKYMNLVPVGVQGEICIAGMNVGQGYLNNPELTNEKFIDNPFGEGKLYRTGDLGYRCEDGNIVFIGRNDFQVKIHGQRIELGEIENAVSSVDGITLCVAAVREDAEGRQYICVFYTGEEKTAKEIKDTISGTLPKYMVPNIFTYLSEMPLTSSGKINRKALPEVDPVSIVTNEEYIAPETNEEKALAEVVCKVLKMENINMLDNFFYLGGDSIIAIHIVSLLEEMGYALRVANIMMSETLSDIAKKMTPVSDSAIYDQNETNGLVSFSPVMRAYLNEHGATENNFVQHCVITADCDENEAKAALDALVAHHDILRGTIEENGLLIHPCAEREVYSFNSISIADTEKAKQYLNNINVSDNTLINAVFCTTENGNLMSITVHHFLVDLVSWEILIADFNTAIKQIRSNEDISLPAKTATFGMWNEKLKGYKENISPESKEYWEDINRNLEKTKTFVSDSVNKAEEYNFAFDKTVSEKLMGEANKAYSTKIHEILLTATGLAAGTIAGGDIGVLVEGHGRADPDNQISVDRTVGWFTSCYPVIVRNNGNVAEEIITTKETLRRISSKGIDYLLLNEKVHRNTSIVFNYYKNNVNDNGFVAFGGAGALFPDKINFNCFVDDGILKVNISVSESRHVENICEKLGLEFRKQLEKIVEFCTGATTVVRTRSDFSDTELTEQEFIELTEQFDMQYIENISALTPSQEGIFAQYIQNPETKTYKLSNLIRVGKDTDIEMLRKSVRLLAVRHSVLRTAFAVMKSTGAIKQVVLSDRLPEFKVISVNEPFSQNVSDTISAEITSGAFDLHKDSLFRITVIDFNDARFIHMHTHHIILDGWCFPVIINDIQKVYAELSVGKTEQEIYEGISNESASETSYSDYVAWIRNQDKTQASVYWKNLLDDFEASHIFGKEKKDNSKNEDIFTFRTPLEEELSQRIRKFARENNVSFNTVFECAFGVALQKFSGSDDVVYDKIISGRSIPLSNVSETLGLFINTVPVRIRSEEKTSVADLLKATQKQTAEADKNGILPLADVYKNSSVESRSVDALFVFENYFTGEESEITNGILTPELISFDEQTEFNLTVTIIREGSGYAVRTSYAREIYSEREISDFVKGYIYVLEAALDNKKLIRDIDVISQNEKHRILIQFNDTKVEYDENNCIYNLFEAQAKINPDKTAVVFKNVAFSYSELLELTEEYAGKLAAMGVENGDTVAIHLERNHKLVILQLAVLKIGGIFLPVDKRYPEERINYACKDCNVKLLITDEKIKADTSVIRISDFENTEAQKAETVINNDSCYIIYTSGSTGKPKGCLLTGKGLLNFCVNNNTLETLEKIENCTFACVNAVSFDYFIAESLLPLVNGFTTVVLDDAESTLQNRFMPVVRKNNINVLMTTPTRLKIYFDDKDDADALGQLKCICTSGEPLTAELLSRMYEKSPEAVVYNPIGPSECSVWDMGGKLCREDGIDIHIGKPVANAQIYITDKYMNPVPVGVTGEICIAGDGVGNGYVNNPGLTKEKFIDNPFGAGKLYKTGDLGFWRNDGNIVFVGRNDFQVKVRGLRIELGEIENAVSSVDGISLSVAVVREDKQGRQHICVFYTGEEKASAFIKEKISSRLPKYMLPHIFIHLPEMPLTSSGKINRTSLAFEELTFDDVSVYEAPLNEAEKHICDVFERILAVGSIGRNSDFFETGGTSISMISLLSDSFFDCITAAEFMQNSTPAELAALMAQKNRVKYEYLEPLYVAEKSEKAMILTPYGGGGAEAFAKFITQFRKKYDDVSVYFIRFLHSDEECENAAKEIEMLLSGSEVSLYSHCAGASVALKIIEKLEKDNFNIRNFNTAAFIPAEERSNRNIWKNAPEFAIRRLLDSSGAKFNEVSKEMRKKIMKRFRADTDYASHVFYEFKGRITTPVTVIISEDDYFTKDFENAHKCWSCYAENVNAVKFIDSKSHYFQSDNAEEVVRLIEM